MSKMGIFSKSLVPAAALSITASLAGGSALAQTELNLSYFVGAPHPMNAAVVQPFKAKPSKRLVLIMTVTGHFGGSLVKGGPPQYGALVQGVSDIAFGLPGYTGQVFPFSTVGDRPRYYRQMPSTRPTSSGTRSIWSRRNIAPRSSPYGRSIRKSC